MFTVKDGARSLKFSGKKLADSSSWREGSNRWIEFELYRTDSGSFILARVGVSLIYHSASCELVNRYHLVECSVTELERDAVPCPECRATLEAPVVFPEKYRHWAMVADNPYSVLEALYKEDQNGTRYLTRVADRLLRDAARRDPEIESVYRVEFIP